MTYREIKLIVQTVLWTLFAVFMIYVGWSWIDVLAHQGINGGTQNQYNLFWILAYK